ncbi:unnamed protein product, partial [Meganyctiphanes norvegica]
DRNCCLPSTLADEELSWLPDPILTSDGEHFKPYSEVKGSETTEDDRPSLKSKVSSKTKPQKDNEPPSKKIRQEIIHEDDDNVIASVPNFADSSMCTGQNARAVATCTECRKPRVVYSRTALSETHRVTLAILLSEFDYTCGAPLTPPDSSLYSRVMTKANLQCGVVVEMSYYSTTANIG